ncbi:MAG: DUF362 domain-containing protein [Caldilineaceae bacterium]
MKLLEQIKQLDFPADLPETVLNVHQTFDAPDVGDIDAAVQKALKEDGLLARMKPGATVAVGVGSRGIANIPQITKATVDGLRAAGMKPFVLPAMGSHGGATAEGQKEVLTNLGVTEASVGCEIKATMEVQQIGQIPDGPPLYQDVLSAGADHCILISRIKPHTDFRSHLESGPSKMCVIGWGKQFGAAIMHGGGGANFQKYLAPAARIYETNTNFVGAVSVVENAYDGTAKIVGLTADKVGLEPEAKLLERPKPSWPTCLSPKLIFWWSADGQEYQRHRHGHQHHQPSAHSAPAEEFGNIDIAVIAVLDLTEETHGNACGFGLANITPRVVNKTDWVATYTNTITSGIFGMYRTSMPLTMPTDKSALEVAMRGCARPWADARMVFIDDTLTLDNIWVSPNLREAVEAHPRLSIKGEYKLEFDDCGTMQYPWALC